jgi:magnesium transporter
MSETETEITVPLPEDARDPIHDEDDRLSHDFVRLVVDHVEAGELDEARAEVERLHPADIADLLELAPADSRMALAAPR